MFWGHFLAIAVALVAVAVLVAANTYAFNKSVGDIYGGFFYNVDTAVDVPLEANLGVLREGVRWSRTTRDQVNIWCAVLFVFAVFIAFYFMAQARRYSR